MKAARAARAEPRAAALIAKGLFDTLNDAKAEDDLGQRDALLDELRALSRAHGEDAAVREPLAKGLFNTLACATEQNHLNPATRCSTSCAPWLKAIPMMRSCRRLGDGWRSS